VNESKIIPPHLLLRISNPARRIAKARTMDDIVLRSMLKWPNVPSVYGWLRLDRRGRWLIRMPGEVPRFERVVNPAMIEFIGRNYTHDEQGRYFFQNGPQRVFVALEYTPWVWRLDGAGAQLLAHTGVPAGAPREAYVDEQGGLILVCGPGVGAVLDRDLAALAEGIRGQAGAAIDLEALIASAHAGSGVRAHIAGGEVTVGAIRSQDLPVRFGYVPNPRPPVGQPDC
jgi:hypothetical protein